MSDPKRWTIFAVLNQDFIARIKFGVVFGTNGTEAIIVTDDQQVYGIGTNQNSCLGMGNGFNTLDPIRIGELCERDVQQLAFGAGPHVLALTSSGELYSWGHNAFGQLGHNNLSLGVCPAPIVFQSLASKILEVACGAHHSVVCTENGEVFTWGCNNCGQLGLNNNVNQPSAKKVRGNIANKFVKHVACSQNSTTFLTDDGEVYCCGLNGNGQLGIGNLTNQCVPNRVLDLQENIVCRVVCGFAHVLALTDKGEVYAWGSNSCGQLAQPSRINHGFGNNFVLPVKTVSDIGRVADIAAVHACNISAAVTPDNRVFMWGLIRGQCIAHPQLTQFSLLDDIFACFACPSVSWRSLKFGNDGILLVTVRYNCIDFSRIKCS